MPKEFELRLESAAATLGADRDDPQERLDCEVSRADGLYFFLDLPEGKYSLKAIDPKTGTQDGKSVSVSKDKKQNIKMEQADFTLAP